MHFVWKSRLNGSFYFWHVVHRSGNKTSQSLASGWTYTEEQAVRNARNFIKNNQNAVYA